MKKIGFFLAAALMLTGCSAKTEKTVQEAKQTNESLKICIDGSSKSLFLDQSLINFKKAHPQVKVEIQEVSANENERGKVEAELMAGDGADIYVNPERVLNDVYKAQRTGTLEDLMPWFEKEEGFNQEDYLEGTFDLYENSQECYVFPVLIQNSFLAVYRGKEEELGLGTEDWKKAPDILENIELFCEKYPKDTPFIKYEPYSQTPDFYGMRVWKGIEENKKVLALPQIRRSMELYKKQAYADGKNISMIEDYEAYENEQNKVYSAENTCLGSQITGISNLETYVRMGGEETADLYTDRDSEGNSAIKAYFCNISISAASKNKSNAFELLNYIREDMHHLGALMTSEKDVNKEMLKQLRTKYGQDEVLLDGQVYKGLGDATFQLLEDTFTNGKIVPYDFISGKFWDHMMPFFQDKKDYDTCIKEFTDYMEIYYSE